MTLNHGLESVYAPRGAPIPQRPQRRHAFLMGFFALACLAQTGCQSGFYGPCGATPCGRPLWGARWFQPAPVVASSGCCGPTVGMPITTGPTSVGPTLPFGTSAVPSGSGVISTVPEMGTGSELQPAPPTAAPGPAIDSTPSTGAKPTTGKVNYEARQPSTGNNQASAATASSSRRACPYRRLKPCADPTVGTGVGCGWNRSTKARRGVHRARQLTSSGDPRVQTLDGLNNPPHPATGRSRQEFRVNLRAASFREYFGRTGDRSLRRCGIEARGGEPPQLCRTRLVAHQGISHDTRPSRVRLGFSLVSQGSRSPRISLCFSSHFPENIGPSTYYPFLF